MINIGWKDKVMNMTVQDKVKKERKKHVEYNLAMKTQMIGACA